MQDFDKDIVWQLFKQTGNPAYFSLYSRLKNHDGKDN